MKLCIGLFFFFASLLGAGYLALFVHWADMDASESMAAISIVLIAFGVGLMLLIFGEDTDDANAKGPGIPTIPSSARREYHDFWFRPRD